MTLETADAASRHRLAAPALPAGGTPAPVAAARIEGGDAPASTATPYTIAVGDTFSGNLVEDSDWVRIQLVGGRAYSFELNGSGGMPIDDPLLVLRDAAGRELARDDDGGPGYDAHLDFTPGASGTYYLDLGSYLSASRGGYRLTTAVEQPWTMPQIAEYLTDTFWQMNGDGRRAFDLAPGEVLTYDVTALTADGQRLATAALAAWSAMTGLRFQAAGGAAADITFDDEDMGQAYSTSNTYDGTIYNSFVNVARDWIETYGTGWASYSYQTYIHEIGHALGLGHAGNYNGTADWGVDNAYLNDSWQATVMSYFSQDDNPNIAAGRAFLMTPMVADLLAMQTLYGLPQNLRAGNTVYGDGTTAGNAYAIATAMMRSGAAEPVAFTIFDQGGIDTLNLAGYGGNQWIDLRPLMHSSAYGTAGNISIAAGTVIENAVGGGGSDGMLGNGAANDLRGAGGADTIYGFHGNDRLVGGPGGDRLFGGAGNDVYVLDAGDAGDVLTELAGEGWDHVYSAATAWLGANFEGLTLLGTAVADAWGNALANRLAGNAAANVLVGGGGADAMLGGAGNDIYYADPTDTVTELAGGGYDILRSAATAVLALHVEALELVGTAAVHATGNAAANRLTGNAAGNRLDGGGGADTLVGGAGSDLYVTDGGDTLIEAAGGGIDTVWTTVGLTLGAQFENLSLGGAAAINGFGNALDNLLRGNGAANALVGVGGDDTLWGGGGADRFFFDSGADAVADFQDDTDVLVFSRALFGGRTGVSAQEVLAHGRMVAGDAVFTFAGATLTVADVASLASLGDDLLVV